MREFKKKTFAKDKKGPPTLTREIIKKFCRFCRDKVKDIDYKDLNRLQRFITEKGKIMSTRISGNCAKHQRKLTVSIKRARSLALLPYIKY